MIPGDMSYPEKQSYDLYKKGEIVPTQVKTLLFYFLESGLFQLSKSSWCHVNKSLFNLGCGAVWQRSCIESNFDSSPVQRKWWWPSM